MKSHWWIIRATQPCNMKQKATLISFYTYFTLMRNQPKFGASPLPYIVLD